MKRVLSILAVAVLLVSCEKDHKTDKTAEVNATVLSYVSMVRGNSWMMGDVVAIVPISDNALTISVTPYNYPQFSASSIYDGKGADKYRELQIKYGDHNPTKSTLRLYDNRGWVLESGVCNYDCYSDKINKISITSDKSWGENYPAGADLAPLFTVEFSSLAEYVKRGFAGEISRYYSKVVSEVDPELYNLLNASKFSGLMFQSATFPADAREHTYTVTLTLDTGEQIAYHN
jgi:hypothetical protein